MPWHFEATGPPAEGMGKPGPLGRAKGFLLRIFSAVILVASLCGHAWAGLDPDFRLIRWGMNRFQVIASEALSPIGFEPGEILYRVLLFDRPSLLAYRFSDGRLVSARYVLPTKSSDSMDGIANLLAMRYGLSDASFQGMPEGESVRVWSGREKTVRLYLRPEGEAIIDIFSPATQRALEVKRFRQNRALKRDMKRYF